MLVGSVKLPFGPLHFNTTEEQPEVASGMLPSGQSLGHPSVAGVEPSLHKGTTAAHPVFGFG